MNATPRHWALGLALAATLAASLWLSEADEPDVVTARAAVQPLTGTRPAGVPRLDAQGRTSAPPAAAATVAPPRLTAIQRSPWPPVGDTALRAWMPAPPRVARLASATPPQQPAPPPSAPVAPVFPYQWIGRVESAGGAQIFLASAQSSTAARVGDVLDGQWRVDSIRPTAVQLTWLAHNLPVTIGMRNP